MWGLSSSIFVAAMSTFFRERKPELPLIALSGALLFALPNVRNAQPGIPNVVGTISDMIGYFFNMLLIATRYAVLMPCPRRAKLTRSISLFSLLARLIVMSRRVCRRFLSCGRELY
jgi:ABC-type Co2+ transport system permease subunit